jgi:putative spermidine/putrescine transport system ATP-binding protein
MIEVTEVPALGGSRVADGGVALETGAHLRVECVRRTFARGSVHALEDVSMSLARGEFVALLGPSGSGKTTLLRIVAGLERPDAGRVLLAGEDITRTPPQRRRMGMVFQSYALFPHMTAADNVAFGLRVRRVPGTEVRRRVADLLALVGLLDKADRLPSQLSGGEQQRVALARALAPHPEVLLLDEPLSALDARIRVGLRAEIRRIQRHLGITALYVTHDQEEALMLADRVVVMRAGRIEQVGTPRDVYERPATPFVSEFVGTTNRLAARVEDPTAGEVSVAGQRVRLVALPAGLAPGDEVTLAVRPEEIDLAPGPDGDLRRLVGQVEDTHFLGAHTLVRARVGDQEVWVDRARGPALDALVPGAPIHLYLPTHPPVLSAAPGVPKAEPLVRTEG